MILADQSGTLAIAAALTISLCGFGAAIAQRVIGAEALYKMVYSDVPFGKFLILVAIPETILIAGFVIAILIKMLNTV